jgi:hypothetical protein
MTGLLSSFTAYEYLTLSATISKASGGHQVTITVTNDGTLTANVTKILIDAVDKSSDFGLTAPDSGIIPPQATKTFSATIAGLTSGKVVKITVVTLRGSYEIQLKVP